MTILEGIGLGTLQGVTEFLPVSSSGHLVFARALFGIHEAPITLEVTLHAASLVAMLVYFRREVISLMTTRRRLVPAIIVGSVPAGVVGLLLRDRIEALFENPLAAALGLLVTGTVLWVSERLATDSRSLDSVRLGDAFWVGIAQAIALMTGVSRSGMTVGAGLASGLQRGAAVAFGFLLGIVAIGGVTLLEGRKIIALGVSNPVPLAAGFVASLLVSLGSLSLLTLVVRRKRLVVFAMYCYVIGSAVLLAKLTGMW